MVSGGRSNGSCKDCGKRPQNKTLNFEGLCVACASERHRRLLLKKGCIHCVHLNSDLKEGKCNGCFRTLDKKNFTYKENKMSDGITDSSRDSEAHKKLGGSTYCDKCGKYHPVLPFCPEDVTNRDVEQPDLKPDCSERKSAKIVLQDAMMDLNRSIEKIEQERVAITLMYDSIDWNNLTVLEEESLYYFLTNKLTPHQTK